ncbi:hypothetical protein IQ264_30725 [Phormidium sp. LEGE 05292]|uniref:hypothetical protein n=1 Tax=[Phormidium] sp. LEGE 05292 TaxID=767427 RepID=UPI0018815BCD|nr:hypothetical protein [Phormidium sp. LEGE 05292]MBE9229781.1 hypothetical protein [Phormidium sp. LEGE 05292]
MTDRITANVKSLHTVHKIYLVSDRVTLSCGVASMIPDFTTSLSKLINSPHQAL